MAEKKQGQSQIEPSVPTWSTSRGVVTIISRAAHVLRRTGNVWQQRARKLSPAESETSESPSSGTVDWSEDAPGRNMYGCLPCPKCGSKYRASYTNSKMSKKLGHPTVECDECGFVERAFVVESKD